MLYRDPKGEENRMRKNGITIAAVLLAGCMLLLKVPAQADIIFEPYGDEFWEKHGSECTSEYVADYYLVAEENGQEPVMKSPLSDKVSGKLDGGLLIWSNTTYTDESGMIWRYFEGHVSEIIDFNMFEVTPGEVKFSGWIRDSSLRRVYDSKLFTEEHAKELTEDSEEIEVPLTEYLYLYRYPNGPLYHSVQNPGNSEMPLLTDTAYQDEYGRRWGHIEYYYGNRDCWICLVTPDLDYYELRKAADLPDDDSEKAKMPVTVAPENGPAAPEEKKDPVGAIAAAVLVVMGFTVAVLFAVRKKGMKS